MGVIRTDKWEERFEHPLSVCRRAVPNEDERRFYLYLKNFGMYKPGKEAGEIWEQLAKLNVWQEVDQYLQTYRSQWRGPDVDIFIFPIDRTNAMLMRNSKGRSGLAFQDKMFLFLSEHSDKEGRESLFVHEYHHVVRMNRLKKQASQYTLLDSLVFEGLAEYAVKTHCGESSLADWTHRHEEAEMRAYWKRMYEPNLDIPKKDPLHDQLLFGKRKLPHLLGYSIGYWLVDSYMRHRKVRISETFSLPSARILAGAKIGDGS